ncbi:MAG: tetratricopeptide repeat protein [Kiritimatiellales bacterium]|nr:tetratricopeptide repeat protein [Kiritimatiellales bacterium]
MMLGSHRNTVHTLLLVACIQGAVVYAQTDYSSWGITDVVGAADAHLLRGEYEMAIPALQEVVSRMRRMDDAEALETLQKARFQLARAYYQNGDTDDAVTLLEEYLESEPRKKELAALSMVAQIYFDQNRWEDVERISLKMLAIPDVAAKEITTGNLLLGQALFRQNKWTEAVKPLTIASETTENERTREVMQIMIVRSLVKDKRFRELYVWIPKLYSTDAKYDITLNIALMNAGKARFDTRDYLNSLMLYRMVLPREELLRYQTRKIKRLETTLAAQAKIGMKAEDESLRQREIDDIKVAIKALEELPPYEDEVTFRIGQVYNEVWRFWEGLALYERLLKKDPTSEIGEAALYKSVMAYYDVDEPARAEKHIIEYLDRNIAGQHARPLLSVMLRDNIQKKNFDKVVGMMDYFSRLPPPQDAQGRLLQADMHYMFAFGYFLKEPKECEKACSQFSTIIDSYSESPSVSDAIYYRGLTYMFLADYTNALEQFLMYQSKYPTGEQMSVSVFREGVCLFGLERIDEAVKVFTRFIKTYPTDDLVSEAYSMRADINGSKGLLDEAIADYKLGIETAKTPVQASYAVFNAAKVYQAEDRSEEIIAIMTGYIDRFKEEADMAQAVYWIGQSQIRLGRAEEAIAAYFDVIKKFGNQADQTGVDKIITELVDLYETGLTEQEQGSVSLKLAGQASSVEASDAVLQLRLKVVMAWFAGEKAAAQLGEELLRTQSDLSATTPVALALMCDAALRLGDQTQMTRVHDYFMKTYEDSDLIWKAYRIKMTQLLEKKEYEQVLTVLDDVQGIFGADYFMDWAQITKANVLRKLGRFEEAFKEYNHVLGVTEWRGPIFAEAMCGMGQCRKAQGNYEKAFAYFQRTYLLYKGYDNGYWAAEAYLGSVECLRSMGDEVQAVKTLHAMLEDDYVNELPQAETARKLLKDSSEA